MIDFNALYKVSYGLYIVCSGSREYGNGYISNTGEIFGLSIYHTFAKPYGFLIGAAFSGVIGTGFYPLLGSRAWCRFGCPMAGYLGLLQRFFSRFRITTNGGQCISCGNCSTYCEMGIDVRDVAAAPNEGTSPIYAFRETFEHAELRNREPLGRFVHLDDQPRHVALVIPDDTLRNLHNKNAGLNNLLFCFIDTVRDSDAIPNSS